MVPDEMKEKLRKSAKLLLEARYVSGLTGAGISVESGIRPFRGPGGIWTEKGEPAFNGFQRFLADPKKYWENRLERQSSSSFRSSILASEPNPGHRSLAEIEIMGILKSLITQNIDDLHNVAGSKNVIEIHGNMKKRRCIKCNSRYTIDKIDFSELPPLCGECGGFVKGDSVMFGEPIPPDVLRQCYQEADKSDLMLVIGTSALVYPAASLPLIVKDSGGLLIEMNTMETPLSSVCDLCFIGPSGETLPLLVNQVKKEVNDFQA